MILCLVGSNDHSSDFTCIPPGNPGGMTVEDSDDRRSAGMIGTLAPFDSTHEYSNYQR